MNDFEQQIAALSPEQRIIFEKRIKQKRLNKERTQEISKIEIPKRKDYTQIPLSFAQQRLWFVKQLNPDNSAYNIYSALVLEGKLNIALLENVFTEIVRRHETLRTTFITNSEGLPIQVIAPSHPFKISIIDLKEIPDRHKELQRLACKEIEKPFDLTKPLLRITLLKLAETEYVLLITFHHIISDYWSVGIFVREMKVLYEAFLNKQNSGQTPLSELPIQYADWAIWQQQYLQGKVLEVQTNYWKKQLANLPVLRLPTDRLRPAIATHKGAKQSFEFSKTLLDALKTLSRKEGVTLFTLLLTVFKVLLYKYTNQDDIAVGSDIVNRNRVETEGLIGFLINTLVLRTDLSGNPTFTQLLSRVRKVTIKAYDHQDLSFNKLVDILKPERDISEMVPLFQVKFDLQLAKVEPLELSNLTISSLNFDNPTARLELRFNLLETDNGLTVLVTYSTDIFDINTITRMVEHYRNLLERIVADPQQHLWELSLLTESEKRQLLWDWNNIEIDYPQNKCIHELFETQLETTPDAVAVIFEDQQLTYRELNVRANQLAHHLRSLGVKPEVLVGICVERSLGMVIGLLAILKAGGAYVPLDPNYPQERIAFILEDTQAQVLLTQASLLESIPQHKAQVICLDTDWHLITQHSQENLCSLATTENLAYTIYTSGSTGKPKGVMIKHASTVAMLDWANETFAIEARAGVLASTSICFNLSVFEVFVPLCYGGKVILIENALHLPTLPAANGVTLINTIPSVISQLVRNDSIPNSVQTVNIAGEPLQNQLVQKLYKQDNIKQVFNLYGLSEDTTYSTLAWIKKGASNTPLIGRPINNTQTYLLNKNLQLVPVGVPGMLYIGGAGLARGYLNKAEFTADKFIPNLYAKLPGERLYKTGDLARYLPSGDIQYLGRIDNQVKVRGFPIKLGEIEAIISQYPAVRETVVVVREDKVDSQRIVAYVVAHLQQKLTITELRNFLESKLPNYMVPKIFVTLETLPLTPNGKVDREALPVPDVSRSEAEFVLPRNSTEETVASIYAEILKQEKISINDNFFELGGNSLLITQLAARLLETFEAEVSIVDLFKASTVANLAERIEKIQTLERIYTPAEMNEEKEEIEI